MHDPTEGGIAQGLYEMAIAAGVGIVVERDKIPILPECIEICKATAIDPLGLLASGALLIAIPHDETTRLIGGLHDSGINAVKIGSMVERRKGMKMLTGERLKNLPQFERDELARFLDLHASSTSSSISASNL
jgi:hydrogenase maturation factor